MTMCKHYTKRLLLSDLSKAFQNGLVIPTFSIANLILNYNILSYPFIVKSQPIPSLLLPKSHPSEDQLCDLDIAINATANTEGIGRGTYVCLCLSSTLAKRSPSRDLCLINSNEDKSNNYY